MTDRRMGVNTMALKTSGKSAKAAKKAVAKKSGSQESKSPSQLIDARIKELGDWRGNTLRRLRTLVKEADPEVVEEWKWRGVPVWEHDLSLIHI